MLNNDLFYEQKDFSMLAVSLENDFSDKPVFLSSCIFF